MWVCNQCGSENEDMFYNCSQCGAERQEYIMDPVEYSEGDVDLGELTGREYLEDTLGEEQEVVRQEPVRPRKKKKKKGLRRRLKAFCHNLAKLPTGSLILFFGSIVLVLVLVILGAIFLPRLFRKESAPVSSVVETPVPVSVPETEKTPEPTATPEPTPEPQPEFTLDLPDGRSYLKAGDSAPIVATIQQRLVDLGYMKMPVVDGVAAPTTTYGKTTKEAIRKFQYINGITCDGTVGQVTYDALMAEEAKTFRLSGAFDQNLFEDDNVALQVRLRELGYLPIASGKFDDATVAALKAFQEANGLKADGVAGLETLRVINSEEAVAAK